MQLDHRPCVVRRYIIQRGAFFLVWPAMKWTTKRADATPFASWQLGMVTVGGGRAVRIADVQAPPVQEFTGTTPAEELDFFED